MLRAALDTDRDIILDWRNHPDVRQVSLTTHVIGVDEHRAWWARSADDPSRRVLIFEHDGTPAGVVMFADIDPVAKSATWGFYLDVAGLTRRGALLPAWMRLEQEAVAYAFDELGLDSLGGETLASNTQVLALHRRFGFSETRRYRRDVDGTPTDVVWTERGKKVNQQFEVAGTTVGAGLRPYIVAEMSGNHNGSLDRALALVDAVAESGAHALKIQTYTADTLTVNVDHPRFRISSGHDLWGGDHLYQLFERAHTPWAWHEPIFERARSRGLTPFSSPFDPTAIDLLEKLDAPLYKIASSEIVDLPLIRLAAATGKPMIISTGMASVAEIAAAVQAAKDGGCTDLVVLSCTASYPAPPEQTNLRRIPVLAEVFGVPIGLSDHTLGIGVPIAAVAFGACLIEKHVTLDRTDGGVDSAFSLEPSELAALVVESERAWQALGSTSIGPTEAEKESLRFRRSLFVVEDVRAGDEVTAANVRSIRPAGGLAPDEIGTVLGRSFREDTPKGTPLTWDLI